MNKLLKILIIPTLFISSCGINHNKDSSIEPYTEYIEVEEATSYQTETKNIYREDIKLYGELYLPNNSYDEFPLVILSHGLIRCGFFYFYIFIRWFLYRTIFIVVNPTTRNK